MKRFWILGFVLILAVGAFAVYAESGSTLIVKPSDMKSGETKTFTDDGRTITVTRDGNTSVIKIEDAGKVERLTITRDGDRITIGQRGDHGNSFFVGPNRREIIIDGVPLSKMLDDTLPAPRHRMQTWFICPKDHAMLRVPDGKDDQTYKCPVDGTTMEKKKGSGFTFFFNNNLFESNDL